MGHKTRTVFEICKDQNISVFAAMIEEKSGVAETRRFFGFLQWLWKSGQS